MGGTWAKAISFAILLSIAFGDSAWAQRRGIMYRSAPALAMELNDPAFALAKFQMKSRTSTIPAATIDDRGTEKTFLETRIAAVGAAKLIDLDQVLDALDSPKTDYRWEGDFVGQPGKPIKFLAAVPAGDDEAAVVLDIEDGDASFQLFFTAFENGKLNGLMKEPDALKYERWTPEDSTKTYCRYDRPDDRPGFIWIAYGPPKRAQKEHAAKEP